MTPSWCNKNAVARWSQANQFVVVHDAHKQLYDNAFCCWYEHVAMPLVYHPSIFSIAAY